MGDRLTVESLVADVIKYLSSDKEHASKNISEQSIRGFLDTFVNEQLSDEQTFQFVDTYVVDVAHPGWSLKDSKKYAAETIGLEESLRFFQLYCQSPRKKPIFQTPFQDIQELTCGYFVEKWKERLPSQSHSVKATALIPLKPGLQAEDGDTVLVCYDEKGNEECHSVRLVGFDTEESLEENRGVIDLPANAAIPQDWKLEDSYCYKDPARGDFCAHRVVMPNYKLERQANETWGAMIRIFEVKNPSLAKKLKNEDVRAAMISAGNEATKYRGKVGTFIMQDLIRYVESNGASFSVEPAYAVKNTKDEEHRRDGRLVGVDRYGRMLHWLVATGDEDILLKYLRDQEKGISRLGANELNDYYKAAKKRIEAELDKVDLEKMGLTKEETKTLREWFLSAVIDPSKAFEVSRTTIMADEWEKDSKKFDYHYTNNVNLFMLFCGAGSNMNFNFPDIRSGITRFVTKVAAKMGNGLFFSPVIVQTRAGWGTQKEQLENPEKIELK